MEQNRLILLGRYNQQFVQNELIPEIENNCLKYGVLFPDAYEVFQKNKSAPDSLYFHHLYAESDVPIGQEYSKIAIADGYEILPHSIQDCNSRVLCFFTAFRSQPSSSAMRGHHELSLIQFEQGIPQIIYDELQELTKAPIDLSRRNICLY